MARDVVARIDAWQAVANIQGRAADPFALLGFSDGATQRTRGLMPEVKSHASMGGIPPVFTDLWIDTA